jgi:tRNA pseudouridine55 synthase
VNGILVIDKPAGITSHDVVAKVRRILRTKRVGHTGTLDPFATGVMVVLVGQATRLAQFLDKDEKEYVALVRFGFETDTGDRTGERRDTETERREEIVTEEEIDAVLGAFRGNIEQVPPMYSAKKIDGKKLYELARKGETVERKAVKVRISELELSESPANTGGSDKQMANLRVVCSAGTYIRTLAEDIGRRLGVGAHLEELRRTRAGQFSIDRSVTLEELAEAAEPASLLIPMEQAVARLARFVLPDDRVAKTRSGLSSRVREATFVGDEHIAMFDPQGNLIAVGSYDAAESVIKPRVVIGL